MDIKELKEYLSRFDENEGFSVVVVDTEKRIVHKNKMATFLSDMAALILEVDGTDGCVCVKCNRCGRFDKEVAKDGSSKDE